MSNEVKEFIEKVLSYNQSVRKDALVFRGQINDPEYHLTPGLYREKHLDMSADFKNRLEQIFIDKMNKIYRDVGEIADDKYDELRRTTSGGQAFFRPFEKDERPAIEILKDPHTYVKLKMFCYEEYLIEKIREETYKEGIGVYQHNFHNKRTILDLDIFNNFLGFAELWPSENDYPFLALGQHYRLKTRFLDWTAKPLIAIYFAAKASIEQKQNKCNELCVWVTDRMMIEKARYVKHGKDGAQVITNFYEPPGFFNTNASAQESVLSISRYDFGFEQDNGIEFMTNSELPLGLDQIEEYQSFLGKIATNRTNDSEILKTLDTLYGINAKKLFPGHEGLVEYIKESTYY